MNTPNILDQHHADDYSVYHGDCVALATSVPDNTIDLSVYSPPFSSLYIYGDSEADMGNTETDAEFLEQYRFLVREKHRATRPGRLSAVHIKDLVYYMGSSSDGTSGIRPLSDEVTRIHLEEGWNLHCRITIWRDPVLERAKTNAHGLLYKTFKSDASICRVGMPEYLLVFRKWPKTEQETALQRPIKHDPAACPLPIWQELASPIWNQAEHPDDMSLVIPATCWNYQPGQSGRGDLDLRSTDTLNVKQAQDDKAERHLCPMPLNITDRAITLWSNSGDAVWSPFMGIGSEGVAALRKSRRFIGSELNPNYYQAALGHLAAASRNGVQQDLFALA